MIYLGADHGGFQLKEQVKSWLREWGVDFEDVGAYELDPQDDYPQYALAVARRIQSNDQDKGILLCRSGGGMTILANRLAGVRAVDCGTLQCVEHAREDNDANILSLPADWIVEGDAKEFVRTFLDTPFSRAERHVRRLEMIDTLTAESLATSNNP